MKPLTVLNLGAGVQSSTLLLMACKGVLPKPDAVIFADTQWEPKAVYDHLEWLETQAKAAGIPLYRVTEGNLRQHTMEGFIGGTKNKKQRYASMPLHVIMPQGNKVMIRRQCSREYKIKPIERFIRRELLGLKYKQHAPKDAIDQWFGITADEPQRMRMSDAKWRTNIYPFCNTPVDYFDKFWQRNDCIDWLKTNYPDREVPRSACIGCPFHCNVEWRQIKDHPDEWLDAIEVDMAIRHADGMMGEVYLHNSCMPLDEVDLRTDVEKGQHLLWQNECEGMCGV